jgi:hypothetical protein
MAQREPRDDVSQHILPTAATMVGVCVTVVSIVRLLEATAPHASIIDNVLAGDAVLFLVSALLSYGSLRTPGSTPRLERYGDLVFLSALTILVASSIMLAWEIGTHPIPDRPLRTDAPMVSRLAKDLPGRASAS